MLKDIRAKTRERVVFGYKQIRKYFYRYVVEKSYIDERIDIEWKDRL